MTQIHGKQPIIFCDFDGTITMSDNILALMKHYNPPGWESMLQELLNGQLSLKAAVGQMFALFPSNQRKSIEDYIMENAGIRAGFKELLAYCKKTDIPFYVTSGGIDFFVYPLLAPFDIEPAHIYCNGSNFNSAHIEILWPHPCDEYCDNQCGMCKTRVIRNFPHDEYYRILIGDGLTDYEGSKIVDLVFARSHLLKRCQETNLLHKAFDTFFDVTEHLDQLISLSTDDVLHSQIYKESNR